MLTLLRNRAFTAVVAGHFAIDILNSLGPILLAVLAPSFALSNEQIGLALTLYTFIGSLSQPGFGWLADRVRLPQAALAGIGVGWTALCYAAVALSQRWELLLPCFLAASLGSGLFHPVGTASAGRASHERAGSATSVFFFGGQIGLAIGPALAGLLLRGSGAFGVLPLSLFALLPAALMLTAPAPRPHATALRRSAADATMHVAAIAVVAFILLVAVRSSIQAVYTAFLPKLFADRSWDSGAYGALAGTFMLAAAVGNLVTGELADRYGMRAVTVWPLVPSVPAGLVCIWAPSIGAAFVACALAGLFVGGQHSVLVVHAQRLLPGRQGFAAGLILGFIFAAGGIGTWLAGVAADRIGLPLVMQIVTVLGLPCALLALTLLGRERMPNAAVPAD